MLVFKTGFYTVLLVIVYEKDFYTRHHSFFFFFFFYKIHISPDTGVNDGVWWWGPLSSADQRSRLHSSMDAPKGYLGR